MKTRYEARARIAKALAHPTRLLLLDVLAERERSVGELAGLVGADQSTVSKHLAVLKEVGFISVRGEGATNFYRVSCRCLGGFFNCLEEVLKENLQRQREAI